MSLAAGPGLGQFSYSQSELFQPLSVINTPSGEGFVHMVDGYLFVPFSDDGNLGQNGGFAFFDISDPTNPSAAFVYNNADTNDMVEPHGYGFSDGKLVYCTSSGIVVWDISDPGDVRKLSSLGLGTSTGYGNVCWSVSYQAPYAYIGTGTGGLKIVDLTNPADPFLIRNIPTSELGGVNAHNIHVVGNFLFATATASKKGYLTLDISDPISPSLIDADSNPLLPDIYSAHLNGNRFYALGSDGNFWVYSLDEAGTFNLTAYSESLNQIIPGLNGAYATNQDEFVLAGYSSLIAKFSVADPGNPQLIGTGTSGIDESDDDFAVVMGNLVFVGNDHGQGSAVIPHDANPDTIGPSVNMFSPFNGASNQATSSRIGVTMTDMISPESVTDQTFFVRPVGGSSLSGTYSIQFDKINFWPDMPLAPDTVYEVVIPAGGIRDWSGNRTSSSFLSNFSTGSGQVDPSLSLSCSISGDGPGEINTFTTLTGQAQNATGPVSFSWQFGDGQSDGPTTNPVAMHSYADPGNYAVLMTVNDGTNSATCSFVQPAHAPLQSQRPARSTGVIFNHDNRRSYVVNPDNDTVTTVSETGVKIWEVAVGQEPVSLAQSPSGDIWVVNTDDASLHIIDADTGALERIHNLPRGSRPYGLVFAPDGTAAYVTLEGTGRLLKLDPTSAAVLDDISVGPWPRGLAITGDSSQILITRFISPADHGEIANIAAGDLSLMGTIPLLTDSGPDTESSGRGVPNYLNSVAISPDGLTALVPSKKDNTGRGLSRDGSPLTFESAVRSMAAQLDLTTNSEDLTARVDFDDANLPTDAAYSEFGNHVYVVLQGSNRIEIRDGYRLDSVLGVIEDTGIAPRSIAFDSQFQKLFVHNFLDRTLEIYDISSVSESSDFVAPKLTTVGLVSDEKLDPQVLAGKRIFYSSDDSRMSRDGYLSCASCHLDGMADERVWDFTDRGEGLRNTISLLGRKGTGHGNLHWTANFDEVQDFENDIRSHFGGTGFLTDNLFDDGTRSQPLGDPKAGLSPELDALSAYVSSLGEGHQSPYRNPDGTLTTNAVEGRELFSSSAGCTSCHSGQDFTDTERHDVGTIRNHSGQGSGAPLNGVGFETPTLLGVWETAPYLHDGSAATLREVLDSPSHGSTVGLSDVEKDKIVAYMLQLEVGGSSQLASQTPTVARSGGGSVSYFEVLFILLLARRLTAVARRKIEVEARVRFTRR
ncbi:MAG: Ig-like domain-containing protein [Woeseiaceae bacterium]